MARSELEWVAWLQGHVPPMGGRLALGIGDDMAIVRTPAGTMLMGSDMLLDGVHFDAASHSMLEIGRKCLACCLSDCAAMAVRPLAATVSVALPKSMPDDALESFVDGMHRLAVEFNCAIAGGDTTCWDHPLAVDVAVIAAAYPGISPVRRSGARVGDTICVTGALGGSLLGRHLTFTPRIVEARRMAERLDGRLHAMMDISDGLALDLHRLCAASGVGAVLNERTLEAVISTDARRAAEQDGRTPLDHALSDGEDFELLACIDSGVDDPALAELGLHRIGVVIERGLSVEGGDGTIRPLEPRGYQHR